jgi:putative membrane protein
VYVIALVAELAGTLTGLPFGGYSYGSALGPKLFDAVPFSIPLSWFGMGAAAFGLLSGLRASRFARIALAAVAMTSWDLVLDPAMSSGAAIVKYWEWTEGGPIFGMPLLNLPGWILVSLLLMWWLDRQNGTAAPPARLSAATYAAGVGFSAALCLAAGWWQPVAAVLVALAGIALATVALGRPRPATAHGSPAASGT